jgi:hypothetical protein
MRWEEEVGEPGVSSTGLISVMWGGGRRTGDGARETLAEWMLSVRSGPRKGLVEGVNVNSERLDGKRGGDWDMCG